MAVTILDIARAAGKSYPTVSRALNDHPKISAKTKQEIRVVAEKLGYRPNFAGSALKKGRTGILSVIVPDLGDPFYAEFIRFFKKSAGGYDVVVYDYEENPELERKYLERMLSGCCDGGAAFITSFQHTHDLVEKLWQTRTPLVCIGTPHAPDGNIRYDHATVNTLPCVVQILELLREKGYRNPVRLLGPLPRDIHDFLAEEYRRISVAVHTVQYPPTDQARGGLDAGLELLTNRPETGIILAQNGYQAYGLILAAARCGRKIPDDLAVVINDNSWINRYSTVPLYAVDQRTDELAAAVCRLLERRLSGKDWPEPQRYIQSGNSIIPA